MALGKILTSLLIGCLIGIYAAKFSNFTTEQIILLAGTLAILSTKLARLFVLVVLICGVAVGVWRSEPILDGYDVLEGSFGQQVEIMATVSSDPVYHNSGQYELNANNLHYQNSDIDAVLRIRSFTNDVKRGDRIVVSGKLRDGFAYWQASLYYAEIEIIDRDESNLAVFRSRFIANIFSTIPDPEGSLGLGFLIGVRSLLPDELVGQLSQTGLTHIVAVSGYNLTILASMSKKFFHRGSRFQAAAITFALIFSFVTITGVSPSILRAVIVSSLSIGAWYYGRKISAWILLLYSSSISAMINPSYAWSDIGWYLSLAAFFGVLIIAPLIQRRLYQDKEPKLFTQIAIETTSAQLLTMPIIMLVFGEVSVIALLANVLVLPLIPFSMLLTFMVGASYFVSQTLAGIVAIPTYLVLQFVTNAIRAMSSVEWALVDLEISATQLIVIYGFIVTLWFGLRRKRQPDLL